MWTLSLLMLLGINWLAHASPTDVSRDGMIQTPAQDRKFKDGPSFEINPNFGFRSYHQIRYEPMTVPFEHQDYQAPIPPVDFGIPVNVQYDSGYGTPPEYRRSLNEYRGDYGPYVQDYRGDYGQDYATRQAPYPHF